MTSVHPFPSMEGIVDTYLNNCLSPSFNSSSSIGRGIGGNAIGNQAEIGGENVGYASAMSIIIGKRLIFEGSEGRERNSKGIINILRIISIKDLDFHHWLTFFVDGKGFFIGKHIDLSRKNGFFPLLVAIVAIIESFVVGHMGEDARKHLGYGELDLSFEVNWTLENLLSCPERILIGTGKRFFEGSALIVALKLFGHFSHFESLDSEVSFKSMSAETNRSTIGSILEAESLIGVCKNSSVDEIVGGFLGVRIKNIKIDFFSILGRRIDLDIDLCGTFNGEFAIYFNIKPHIGRKNSHINKLFIAIKSSGNHVDVGILIIDVSC